MGRRSREEWREILAELAESGDAVVEFCQKRGIRVGLLKWWRWQLRSESKRAKKKARTENRRKALAKVAKDVRLVPVTVVGAVPRREGITVVISDLQVRVEVGTDVAYVGAIVRELRSVC